LFSSKMPPARPPPGRYVIMGGMYVHLSHRWLGALQAVSCKMSDAGTAHIQDRCCCCVNWLC
jgi:hypothetical protein